MPPSCRSVSNDRLAPGEHLVRIGLVPHVPHQLVARRVEHVVQRDRELHHAEPRADVAAGARARIDERRAHVVGQRAQLVAGERLQVGGIG